MQWKTDEFDSKGEELTIEVFCYKDKVEYGRPIRILARRTGEKWSIAPDADLSKLLELSGTASPSAERDYKDLALAIVEYVTHCGSRHLTSDNLMDFLERRGHERVVSYPENFGERKTLIPYHRRPQTNAEFIRL